MRSSTQKGLTIVEILLVVAIMTMLYAIVLVGMDLPRQKARDVRRQSDLNELSNALNMFYAHYGYLPGTDNWCAPVSDLIFKGSIEPEYLSKIPQDPLGGSPTRNYYFVNRTNAEGIYLVCANLERPTGVNNIFIDCPGTPVYNYCISE